MNFFGRSTPRVDLRARRLSIEFLERRDLLAIMRLVDWNTANLPNDATDIDIFAEVDEFFASLADRELGAALL